MSDADNAEYGARGPVPVESHVSASPVGRNGHADPRAVALAREREVANVLEGAVTDPTGSILLTELQELRAKIDLIGMVTLTGIWLAGMCIGYAAGLAHVLIMGALRDARIEEKKLDREIAADRLRTAQLRKIAENERQASRNP